MTTTLILGGARSGKSVFAENVAANWPKGSRHYVATWRADLGADPEMDDRIARHRKRRGDDWITIEAGADLDRVIGDCRGPALVDCLTVWLGGLADLPDGDIETAIAQLCNVVSRYQDDLVIVSGELGCGLTPIHASERRYRDHHGRMNQHMASVVDRVVLVTAGIPMALKGIL